jgi:hypothetical protein
MKSRLNIQIFFWLVLHWLKSNFLNPTFLFLSFLSLLSIHSLQAQDKRSPFYQENKYADYPVITFRENFLNLPVYYIKGEKASPQEVRAYLEIMPGDAQDFTANISKLRIGSALYFAGRAVSLGTMAYLFNTELSQENYTTFFLVTLGGEVLESVGGGMERNAKMHLSNILESYNYVIDKDRLGSHYLKMKIEGNLIGQKINIYDGPNMLNKAQIRTLMESRPDMFADYEKAIRKQNFANILDWTGLGLQLVFTWYFISPQFQSSTPNDILLPLIFTNLGLSIVSGQVRRSARNLTRSALDRYNFGDAAVPVSRNSVYQPPIANFVSFGIPLEGRGK